MGFAWVSLLATEAIEIVRKEGLSIPVRALNCETIGGYISKSTNLVEI